MNVLSNSLALSAMGKKTMSFVPSGPNRLRKAVLRQRPLLSELGKDDGLRLEGITLFCEVLWMFRAREIMKKICRSL